MGFGAAPSFPSGPYPVSPLQTYLPQDAPYEIHAFMAETPLGN
ncbi:hypothetical protein C8N45_104123 [Yoonia sediminilitoris]|uniref:Uncharacterized protein n=1 Tax=Yoonia sediminilitoris TaxID=1286148 RepID=A0A2T6KIF5_9RHOB|nr:hypothetical protein C8N45_104123 [Yoonia sediminilitoris]